MFDGILGNTAQGAVCMSFAIKDTSISWLHFRLCGLATVWMGCVTNHALYCCIAASVCGASAMPYAQPQAPKGGNLIRASNGTFDNLNGMNGKGSSTDGVDLLFDSLMSSSLDEPGVMYPLLAEKVSYDPKQTAFVIFHLNPKAKFSDGSRSQQMMSNSVF